MQNIKGIINKIINSVKQDWKELQNPSDELKQKLMEAAKQNAIGMSMPLGNVAASGGKVVGSSILRKLPETIDDVAIKFNSRSRFNPALGRALQIIRGEQKVSLPEYINAGDMVIEYAQKLHNKPIQQLFKRKTLGDLATDLSIALKL